MLKSFNRILKNSKRSNINLANYLEILKKIFRNFKESRKNLYEPHVSRNLSTLSSYS